MPWEFVFLVLSLAAAISNGFRMDETDGIDGIDAMPIDATTRVIINKTDSLPTRNSDMGADEKILNNEEGMFEEADEFAGEYSMDERRPCTPTITCSMLNGYCVRESSKCNGTLDSRGCRGNRKCKCCIPEQTTPAPCFITPTTCPDQTTPAPCFTTPTTSRVPAGFEEYHGRVIRLTISTDTKGSYDITMSYCAKFRAVPFIPRTSVDRNLYREVRTSLDGNMWIPANDRAEEGTMRWHTTGEVASDMGSWPWYDRVFMGGNRESTDCFRYDCCNRSVGGAYVYIRTCTDTGYPPICELLE